MPVTVELSDDALARLRAEAERRGLTIDEILAELVDSLPVEAAAANRELGFVGLGSSHSSRPARDADESLSEGFGRD